LSKFDMQGELGLKLESEKNVVDGAFALSIKFFRQIVGTLRKPSRPVNHPLHA
jgi:hypothetical protein